MMVLFQTYVISILNRIKIGSAFARILNEFETQYRKKKLIIYNRKDMAHSQRKPFMPPTSYAPVRVCAQKWPSQQHEIIKFSNVLGKSQPGTDSSCLATVAAPAGSPSSSSS